MQFFDFFIKKEGHIYKTLFFLYVSVIFCKKNTASNWKLSYWLIKIGGRLPRFNVM